MANGEKNDNGNSLDKKTILRKTTRLIKYFKSSLEILNEIEVDCGFTNGYVKTGKLIDRLKAEYNNISEIYRELLRELPKFKK